MRDEILERIDAWLEAGLIDPATAERLRTAERAEPSVQAARPSNPMQAAGAWFGPPSTIAEWFGYIGAAFLLAAWHVLAPNGTTFQDGLRWFGPAIVFTAIGFGLLRMSERLGRPAGVAFVVATVHVYAGLHAILGPANPPPEPEVLATGLTAAAALAYRRFHPAVLTQIGVLGALLSFATSLLTWLRDVIFGAGASPFQASQSSVLAMALLSAGWWLVWAVALGLLARWEWRIGEEAPIEATPAEAAAARRGRVTRLVAGLTAVLGAMSGVWLSGADGRALEPLVGDGVLILISGVLLAISIRFGSLTYLLPAATGFIAALTDLNAKYVAQQTGTGIALLLEGLILLGTGVVAEQLRRRLAQRRGGAGPAAGDASDLPVAPKLSDPPAEAASAEP
jgi:hypothetical protein